MAELSAAEKNGISHRGRAVQELARYLALGYRSVILDIPPAEEELRHTRAAFQLALERAAP